MIRITTLQLLEEVCGLLFGIKWKQTNSLVWIHAYLTRNFPRTVIEEIKHL